MLDLFMRYSDPYDKVAHLVSHCYLKSDDYDVVILVRGDYKKAMEEEEMSLFDFMEGEWLEGEKKKQWWEHHLSNDFKVYLKAKLDGLRPRAFSLIPMNSKNPAEFLRQRIVAGYAYR